MQGVFQINVQHMEIKYTKHPTTKKISQWIRARKQIIFMIFLFLYFLFYVIFKTHQKIRKNNQLTIHLKNKRITFYNTLNKVKVGFQCQNMSKSTHSRFS
jgi:hypothetical protein